MLGKLNVWPDGGRRWKVKGSCKSYYYSYQMSWPCIYFPWRCFTRNHKCERHEGAQSQWNLLWTMNVSAYSYTSSSSRGDISQDVIFLSPVCSWSKVQPLVPRKRGCVSLALASLQRLPVNQSELIFQISLLVFKVLHVDELLPAHISNLLSPYFTLQPSDPSVNFLFQFHTAFPLLLPDL